jgi:hypothetical protein
MSSEKDWNKIDFINWMNRNGLTHDDVACVFNQHPLTNDLTASNVRDILDGTAPLWEEYEASARRFEAERLVSDDVDMTAAIAELSDKCQTVPQGVITGITAGSLRGWTSANTIVYFVATKSENVAKDYPSNIIPIACDNIMDRVEVRQDSDGNWYRLADPVRMVIDAIRYDVEQDRFSVEELFREAIAEGVRRDELCEFAKRQGDVAVTKLNYYFTLLD